MLIIAASYSQTLMKMERSIIGVQHKDLFCTAEVVVLTYIGYSCYLQPSGHFDNKARLGWYGLTAICVAQ